MNDSNFLDCWEDYIRDVDKRLAFTITLLLKRIGSSRFLLGGILTHAPC